MDVSPDADLATLKKAYRNLAITWHPDHNPGSTLAEERFKAIAEAYAVLSDPNKRRQYDLLGPDNFAGEFSENDIFKGFDLADLFQEFGLESDQESLTRLLAQKDPQAGRGANWQQFFHGFGQKEERQQPSKNPTLSISLALTLSEAVLGSLKLVAYNTQKGVVKVPVSIPPGSVNGQKITLAGQGPADGRNQGDLIIVLSVIPDPHFKRSGQDLLTTLTISQKELTAGCRPSITTLDGRIIRLTIPPGTLPGARFKAPGHGVPDQNGNRGRLIISIVAG